jgi:hypothetical protein
MVFHVKLLSTIGATLGRALDRFTDWYWRDPILRHRHLLEEECRRFGGRITWEEDTRS